MKLKLKIKKMLFLPSLCIKQDLLFEVLFENLFIKSLKHSSFHLLINVSYLINNTLDLTT